MELDFRKGILLEDKDILLEWGTPIRKLINTYDLNIENKGDRTIYYLGKNKILNGLELDLRTMFWNNTLGDYSRRLNRIEHWSCCDQAAIDDYSRLSKHLINQLGEPNTLIEDQEELEMRWELDEIKISLVLFEQHAYKLFFTIEKV